MIDPKGSEEARKIRLVWDAEAGEKIPSHYANHIFVSFAGGTEFHVVFGHLAPPLILDDSIFPTDLNIETVAKLVITPTVMKAFLQVLNDNYKRFESLMEEMEDSDVEQH